MRVMAIYLEKVIEALSNGTRNFTRHTFLISALTLICLTVLQGWIVALPWETDNGSLIGVSVGLSEVGCLIGTLHYTTLNTTHHTLIATQYYFTITLQYNTPHTHCHSLLLHNNTTIQHTTHSFPLITTSQ